MLVSDVTASPQEVTQNIKPATTPQAWVQMQMMKPSDSRKR